MSQTPKLHKISIKSTAPDQASTGVNTKIFIDGVPLKGVTFAKLEFKPGKLTKVVLELIGEIDVEENSFQDVEFKKR